jgi:hypothetical protein
MEGFKNRLMKAVPHWKELAFISFNKIKLLNKLC